MAGSPLTGPLQNDVEAWLSTPRLDKYVAAAAGNYQRGIDLYDWNTAMASALMRDIGYLEVGLRNAYDRALLAAPGPDWVTDPGFTIFSASARPGRSANLTKLAAIEAELRDLLSESRSHVAVPGRGKIVAELMFGFWSKLTSKHLTDSLWTPYLHRVFSPGISRSAISGAVINVNALRNRVAHHEPLFTNTANLQARLDEIEFLLTSVASPVGGHVVATSDSRAELGRCPIPI